MGRERERQHRKLGDDDEEPTESANQRLHQRK